MLVDARGVPLSMVLCGANRHDVTQLAAVLSGKVTESILEKEEEHLCADAAYTGEEAERTMRENGYIPHVRPRGEERLAKIDTPGYKARRWVVEVCHSWLNRFRKLHVRYEKLEKTYYALSHLAFAIIALRKVGVIYG